MNELLTYEKLAAGLHKLELAPADVISFVFEIVEEFYIPAKAKEIALDITSGTCSINIPSTFLIDDIFIVVTIMICSIAFRLLFLSQ